MKKAYQKLAKCRTNIHRIVDETNEIKAQQTVSYFDTSLYVGFNGRT